MGAIMFRHHLDRLRAHQTNIQRYRRLLATRLSELEREYVERRLKNEEATLKALLRQTFPDRLTMRIPSETYSPEIGALLNPADAFGHPMDVVEDCDLTSYEKRAILSSWLANVCAVKSDPSTVLSTTSFDDILDALRALEAGQPTDSHPDGGHSQSSGSRLDSPPFDLS